MIIEVSRANWNLFCDGYFDELWRIPQNFDFNYVPKVDRVKLEIREVKEDICRESGT